MSALSIRSPLASVAVVLLSGLAVAQTCGPKQILLKNDRLPAVPTGTFRFGVVPGLCKNEAAMSVFDAGGPCKVHSVAVLFGHRFGTHGIKAAVDVEIYDGATFNANGTVKLGPLLFKLSKGSTNLQIQSTNLNTFKLPKPVRVPSGRPVIGFRMVVNSAGGSCAAGFDANFCVDGQGTCRKGINILDATQWGPVDPAVYKVGGFIPLCPTFIAGSWVIRACIEPETSTTWTGAATPGGVLSFKFSAPGNAGDSYFAIVSGGRSKGWQSPWGFLPLDLDQVFTCFVGGPCAPLLIGQRGIIGANGQGNGGMLIPNHPSLKNSGFTLYVGFVTFKAPNFTPWTAVSSPSRAIVIN